MSNHNRRIVEEGPDFYPTPRWATLALLEHVKFAGTILEPCCGEGDMSLVLEEAGYRVVSFDLHARGYGRRKDFFKVTTEYSNIVTNPPFGIAEQILEHALSLSTGKVCLLLRLAFLESKKRYESFYSKNPPSKVLVFSERLSLYPKDSKSTGGGTTAYGWFIWEKRIKGATRLEWIKPGLKNGSRKACGGFFQGKC